MYEIFVKLDHETPIFGMNIKKIFELPSPSGPFLGDEFVRFRANSSVPQALYPQPSPRRAKTLALESAIFIGDT